MWKKEEKEDILFSVLIANYNNGQYISQALESIISQNYNHWEAIIVDDASTDDSIEIITPFLSDERIKLYRNDCNSGCGFTKRRCVEYASGEICGFLDPDDMLRADALAVMIKEHSTHPEYGLINSTYYECDEKLHPLKISDNPGPIPDSKVYLIMSGYVSHFAAFKRRIYSETEGIDMYLKKAVDQDLYYKLEDFAPIGYVCKPLYYYRRHRGNISLGHNESLALATHMEVLEKAILRRLSRKEFKIHKNKKITVSLLTELFRIRFVNSKSKHDFFALIANGIAYLSFGVIKKALHYI